MKNAYIPDIYSNLFMSIRIRSSRWSIDIQKGKNGGGGVEGYFIVQVLLSFIF